MDKLTRIRKLETTNWTFIHIQGVEQSLDTLTEWDEVFHVIDADGGRKYHEIERMVSTILYT